MDAVNGLANRFLFLLTDRVRLCPVPARVDASTLDSLAKRVLDALGAAKQVTELRLTRGAEADWHRVYPLLSGEVPGLVGAVLGRAEPHVLRLGGIYALLAEAQEIDVEHLESALAFWDVVDASAREIFRDRTGNALADRLRDSILPGEALAMDEVHDRLGRHAPAARLQRALGLLRRARGIQGCPRGHGRPPAPSGAPASEGRLARRGTAGGSSLMTRDHRQGLRSARKARKAPDTRPIRPFLAFLACPGLRCRP